MKTRALFTWSQTYDLPITTSDAKSENFAVSTTELSQSSGREAIKLLAVIQPC